MTNEERAWQELGREMQTAVMPTVSDRWIEALAAEGERRLAERRRWLVLVSIATGVVALLLVFALWFAFGQPQGQHAVPQPNPMASASATQSPTPEPSTTQTNPAVTTQSSPAVSTQSNPAVTTRTSPPVTTQTSAPVTARTSPPVSTQGSPPVTTQTSPPVTTRTSAPVTTRTSTGAPSTSTATTTGTSTAGTTPATTTALTPARADELLNRARKRDPHDFWFESMGSGGYHLLAPSGRVECAIWPEGRDELPAGCQMSYQVPQLDCRGEFGLESPMVSLGRGGKITPGCTGEGIFVLGGVDGKIAKTLPYGEAITVGDFTMGAFEQGIVLKHERSGEIAVINRATGITIGR